MELPIFLFLGRYGTKALDPCICFQGEWLIKCRIAKHWHTGKLLLECLKCRVTLLAPDNFSSFPGQLMEWLSYFVKSWNESAIIGTWSKESMDFLQAPRDWEFLDCCNKPWVGLEVLWSYDVPKVLNFFLHEMALGWLKLQAGFH